MDCKHIKGSCPEYCISYKKDKKKHCRNPPKTTRSSSLSRRLIEYGLLQHTKDISNPIYSTYIKIRNNLSKDQTKLLKSILGHLEVELATLTAAQKIKLLNEFDLLSYIRLGNSIVNKGDIDNILDILGINKSNSIIDIYNILLVVLLDQKEFIEKYSEQTNRNIIHKKMIDYLVKKSINPKVFLSNPIIQTYITLREQLSMFELNELENKLENTFTQINTILKNKNYDDDILALLKKENFCQYVKYNNKPASEEQINNYLINLDIENKITANKATKCYILSSILATSEHEAVDSL